MKKFHYIPSTLTAFSLSILPALPQAAPAEVPAPPQPALKVVEGKSEAEIELAKLNQTNTLREERLKSELAEMRAQIQRLQVKRELLKEQQEMEDFKKAQADRIKLKEAEDLKAQLERDAAMAKSKAALASSELALLKTKLTRETEIAQVELEALRVSKERKNFADAKPVYLEQPLKKDGTLIISDRRIALNGAIYSETADYICERIHYYNNKDKKLPIFIVIDDSPGGSVMAGYRILKAMDGSDAPIHVVVKSFAASMAASITTLAQESYAYPNAIIMHHQLSSSYFFTTMNLTQQKEAYEDSKKWWSRLADPIAKKMGVTPAEFIKQMYKKNSDGDWYEFADEAKKLKWVNHVVSRIQETAQVVNPDSIEKDEDEDEDNYSKLKETIGTDGKPCMYLPRLNPLDVYFLYNPDGYYRLRK